MKLVAALAAVALGVAVLAGCQPGEGSICHTDHGVTFAYATCSLLLNATMFRAVVTYERPDGARDNAYGPWTGATGYSFAYLPDAEIARGSHALWGSVDFA